MDLDGVVEEPSKEKCIWYETCPERRCDGDGFVV